MKKIERQVTNTIHRAERARQRFVKTGNTEALHDFRSHLRRLREALRLLSPLFEEGAINALQNELRDLARSTNTLRDEHVLHSTVKELAKISRLEREASGWLRQRAARMKKLERAARKRLASIQLQRLHSVIKKPLLNASARKTILRSFKKERRRLQKALKKADPKRYNPLTFHKMRIRAKRVRYGSELFEPLLPKSAGKQQDLAKKAQGVLGRLHDMDVAKQTIARARRLNGLPKGPLLKAIDNERSASMKLSIKTINPLRKALG